MKFFTITTDSECFSEFAKDELAAAKRVATLYLKGHTIQKVEMKQPSSSRLITLWPESSSFAKQASEFIAAVCVFLKKD